jgi:hypothetical protein
MKEPKGSPAAMGDAMGQAHRLPAMDHTMIHFSEMFLDKERFTHIKFPPWLFPRPYARKDQAALTACERERFLCALGVLIANGTYGQLVDIHAQHHAHGLPLRLRASRGPGPSGPPRLTRRRPRCEG